MSSAGPEHDRLPPDPYFRSANGYIYYTPRLSAERRRRAGPGHFPASLIQPRQRRPHSIHIVSYPPGFVPPDLRSPRTSTDISTREKKERRRRRRIKKRIKGEKKEKKREEEERRRADKERSEKKQRRRSLRSLPAGADRFGKVIDKLFAAFSITPKTPAAVSATPTSTPTLKTQSRQSSFISFARRLSRLDPSTPEPIVARELVSEPVNMTGTPVPRLRAGTTTAMPANRNTIMSIRSAKNIMSPSVSEIQKPVASGSGISCSILMAEPNVFLSGFDHDHHTRRGAQSTSALLRGKLQLNVSKNVKIKSITLRLVGKARTEWPEGIPPSKAQLFEETTLRAQSLVFFHAMHEGMWDTEYGSQCTYTHKNPGPMAALQATASSGSLHILGKGRSSTLTAKELKRLSLQSVNSRSFGKGDSPHINQVQAKGYKIFRPGTYEYSFELPIDHSQLETARLPFGSVRWDLETTVERAGAFKPNLHGSREVSIVRLPDQMSLETVEPISISRHWEDQLHYDIVISGKSFPIGAKIPIAFRLTPLAKVQVHKLKVFVTENIEYWTNDRHVTRKDAGRKILLLEKAAGKPLDKRYAASEIRTVSGGEPSPEQREEARRMAARRRMRDASRNCETPQPLPEPSDNLLGDLDLGLESFWGSTEIEMNVQLPTCEMMARDKLLRLHPDCSWKNVNVFHWIKLVMRISRSDPDDPTGKRRRHFEISIDSPFTVLNCRATQANTALPRYSGNEGPIPEQRQQMTCGCPDAQPLDPSSAALARPLTLVEEDFMSVGGRRLRLDAAAGHPSALRAAHRPSGRQTVSSSDARLQPTNPPTGQDRPIHLLRYPSHNPPAFNADEPPPPLPLQTPPPQYDHIVGTPSVDGLADYFARLAAFEGSGGGEDTDGAQTIDRVESDSDRGTIGPDTDTAGDEVTRPSTASTAPPSTSHHTLPSEAVSQTDDSTDPGIGLGLVEGENGGEVNPFNNLTFSPSNGAHGNPGTEATPLAREPTEGDDADAEAEADSSGSEDSADEEDGRARLHRGGRVNVANPRTPGGRLVPSRSLDIERPTVRLDMTDVLRRRGDVAEGRSGDGDRA
ncbi:hypothetical protein P885DRAFT_40707 [Corynascus similis CBS 632.67]